MGEQADYLIDRMIDRALFLAPQRKTRKRKPKPPKAVLFSKSRRVKNLDKKPYQKGAEVFNKL